jgi:hypothetical protein
MVLKQALLGPAVGVFSTIATILAASAIQIWRRHDDISTRRDKAESRENEIRNEMVERLAKLLMIALEEVTDDDVSVDKAALEDTILTNIHKAELNELVPAFTNGGLPCYRFDECLNKYKKAYQQVGLSAFGVVSIPVLLVSSLMLDVNPFSYAFDIAHGTIGVLSAMLLYRGIINFNEAETIRTELL